MKRVLSSQEYFSLESALREKTPYDAEGNHICTCAVFVDESGRMLFGKNLKYGEPVWGTPGGGSEEYDEDVEATVRREIKEECGLTDVEIVDFLGITPGASQGVVMRTFLCRAKSGEPRVMEPDIMPEWRWMTLAELAATGMPFVNQHILQLLQERDIVMGE